MKMSYQSVFLTAAASALLIAGLWSPSAVAEQDGNAGEPTAAQMAEGAKYWSGQCQRCHNLRDPGEFTDDIWDVSVNHMRIRANLPADQARAIKAFLKASN